MSFATADGQPVTLSFTAKWHPGKSLTDYAEMTVTSKSFKQLTSGMNKKELAAIEQGTVTEGIRKKAVVMAYGYPPEHVTTSLNADRWNYWLTRHRQVSICFDEDERMLATCPGKKRIFTEIKELFN